LIEAEFSPAGYNIGFNVGEAAGQTVMHCHCHVITRYVGDVPEPRGGIRGVVPGKRGY
jgi:diadenosine tetraphosphate (Ap4A) HIT family hydrolase